MSLIKFVIIKAYGSMRCIIMFDWKTKKYKTHKNAQVPKGSFSSPKFPITHAITGRVGVGGVNCDKVSP